MTQKTGSAAPADKLDGIRHSLAHLLAAAVLEKFPDTKLGIGPVIENGFYYDFLFEKAPGEEVLAELEKTMRKFANAHLPFVGREVTAAEAKKFFKGQPFKLELIDEYAKEGRTLSIYKTGDIFEDLCRGGHVENTKEINPQAFKLTHMAGAYWRGSEKNPMLTRIYALAFETPKELEAHLKMLEEAKKRDHKVLGPALDLFVFSDLVGPGLPLWTPKGTILRNLLDDFVWQLRKKRGYLRVEIPHITKRDLYEKSGHWEKYKDDLFKITTREGHEFAMKPMNCPHHAQIYARRPWSYRELPQRYANTTMVYRDEQSGELAGLARVLSITQDDAHVFCRMNQVKEEALKIWDIVQEFYQVFNIPLRVRLSLRDPAYPEKYLGDSAQWEVAEKVLRDVADTKGGEIEDGLGEAAFYGPKLDFMGRDAIGRTHQVATIQIDLNQPNRFDLTCVNEKGEKERIVMIHAAIMGSIERFLALAIEHFAGALPVWLAPTQVVVVPVGEKFDAYGKKVYETLLDKGIRAEYSEPTESLGKRVREAEVMKVPYILVVGEKEEKGKSVNVRHYKRGQEGEMALDKFVLKLTEESGKRTA
ncbi:MAG TPA: threonine--tRNA ligase [Candidatus Paceibacterota bacterium]|nr:threonine--tRNA ligase [Candidatus Paceibacterota bacterium]